jgi:thiamine biosynthesis lipoprotein
MLKRCRPLLGTFVEISADREEAIEAGFAAVEQVHWLMSAHEPDSDVARINRFAHLRAVHVHEWTARVLERALFWSKRSEGAFDVVRAGKAAMEFRRLPQHPEQPRPVASHWTWLEIQGASVRLLKPGCIDLGGIAKGFAIDRAVEALRGEGCERGLVNAGGDIRGFGSEPWPTAIVDPQGRRTLAEIDIKDEALATSAGLPCGRGLSFDHLGGGHQRWASISVLARAACDADALTKVVWCGKEGMAAILTKFGARALALTRAGEVELIAEPAEAFA